MNRKNTLPIIAITAALGFGWYYVVGPVSLPTLLLMAGTVVATITLMLMWEIE